MKNLTIGKRIAYGFAAIILILVALGGFAFVRLSAIRAHSDQIARNSIPAVEKIGQVAKNGALFDQIVYKHIGSSDKDDMAQLDNTITAIGEESSKLLSEVEKLVTSEKGRELLAAVKSSRETYVKEREAALVISRQGTNNDKAYQLGRSQMDPASKIYQANLDSLVQFIEADADSSSDKIQSAVNTSQLGIVIALVAALLFGVSIAWFISHSTSKAMNQIAGILNDGAHQVASAADQVSGSSQSLAEGSSEQAASIEETSSSLEEMSSMTKRNAENASQASGLAKEARAVADNGVNDMQSMSTAMNSIKSSSDDIAKIIKTIDEIAFQTNILALNAAVEAARAGEAGMGFAVVADEVRNLAQRSAQAAKETASKIESAISNTAQGVLISGKVAEVLNQIVSKIRQVDELVAEVSSASREQTDGITQINSAVSQMDKVTQSNAANAEESAAAAEELNAQAAQMKTAVADLLRLVSNAQGNAVELTARRRDVSVSAAPAAPKSKPLAKKSPAAALAAQPAGAAARRNEIPLEAGFRDF